MKNNSRTIEIKGSIVLLCEDPEMDYQYNSVSAFDIDKSELKRSSYIELSKNRFNYSGSMTEDNRATMFIENVDKEGCH